MWPTQLLLPDDRTRQQFHTPFILSIIINNISEIHNKGRFRYQISERLELRICPPLSAVGKSILCFIAAAKYAKHGIIDELSTLGCRDNVTRSHHGFRLQVRRSHLPCQRTPCCLPFSVAIFVLPVHTPCRCSESAQRYHVFIHIRKLMMRCERPQYPPQTHRCILITR